MNDKIKEIIKLGKRAEIILKNYNDNYRKQRTENLKFLRKMGLGK